MPCTFWEAEEHRSVWQPRQHRWTTCLPSLLLEARQSPWSPYCRVQTVTIGAGATRCWRVRLLESRSSQKMVSQAGRSSSPAFGSDACAQFGIESSYSERLRDIRSFETLRWPEVGVGNRGPEAKKESRTLASSGDAYLCNYGGRQFLALALHGLIVGPAPVRRS